MTLQDAFNAPRGPGLKGRAEDEGLEMLMTAEIAEIGPHPHGSNYVFIVRPEADVDGGVPVLGGYKPQSG